MLIIIVIISFRQAQVSYTWDFEAKETVSANVCKQQQQQQQQQKTKQNAENGQTVNFESVKAATHCFQIPGTDYGWTFPSEKC